MQQEVKNWLTTTLTKPQGSKDNLVKGLKHNREGVKGYICVNLMDWLTLAVVSIPGVGSLLVEDIDLEAEEFVQHLEEHFAADIATA